MARIRLSKGAVKLGFIIVVLFTLFFFVFNMNLANTQVSKDEGVQTKETITNTQISRTVCTGNSCILTLGISQIYEDGIWKPDEEARSLKSNYQKVYIQKDPDFDIDVIEVNYIYIELNLTFNSSNFAKYPECGASKIDDIKCDFKLTVKEDVWNDTSNSFDKIETKFQYKYQEKNGVKEALKFTQKGIPLGKEYKFGGNSTIITISSNVTGVLANMRGETSVGSEYHDVSFIKFNITDIPANSMINSANMTLYVDSIYLTLDNDVTVWYSPNRTWKEGLTAGMFTALYAGRTNQTSMTFNATPANNAQLQVGVAVQVNESYLKNHGNCTILITDPDNAFGGTANTVATGIEMGDSYNGPYVFFENRANSNGNPGKGPRLIVAYTLLDTTPPQYSLNSTNSTLAGQAISHNLNWTDNTALSGYIFSWNTTGFFVNSTWTSFNSGTWSNFTNTSNSTAGLLISWCFYANDSSNNWNGTSCANPFGYVTTSATCNDVVLNTYFTQINFPNSEVNTNFISATGNSDKTYNVSHTASCTGDYYIKGNSNYLHTDGSTSLAIGNLMFNTSLNSTLTPMITSFWSFKTNLAQTTNTTLYFYLNISSQKAGMYNTSISVRVNATGT